METLQRDQTIAPHCNGALRLAGLSPYFQPATVRKADTVRDIPIILELMNLKALVTGYSVVASAPNISVYLESDDGTIKAGVNVPLTVAYSDTDGTIQPTIAADINAFCAANSLPNPTIDWLMTTPSDLAAAIPVAPSSYQTIVSQTGTAAPIVTSGFSPVSTYAGGTTFTWARTSAGVYTLTASTAVFNVANGKTGVFVAPLQNLNASVRAVVTSTTVITVTTAVQSVAVLGLLGLTTTPTDALLSGTMLYIQTYA